MQDTRLGIILLECPFIRSEEVERCLQIQSLGGWRKPVGQVLLEEGVISAQTLDLVLKIQDRRRTRARVRDDALGAHADEQLPDLGEILERARTINATDLILSQNQRPRARSAGRLAPLSNLAIDRCWMKSFLRAVLDTSARKQLEVEQHVNVRLGGSRGQSCFVQIFQDRHGPSAMIRVVPDAVPSLQDLGHGESVASMLDELRGLVIVGGGPRAGKSTTIASMVQHIASHKPVHVLALDEFHEFTYSGAGLVTRKRVAHDGAAQASALRSSFREDPDVIVVGNLVGAESLELCMQLASTGHLVIIGMQSPSSVAALERLERGIPDGVLDQFRGNLASCLRGIVQQELVSGTNETRLVLATEVVRPSRAFRRAIAEGRYDRIPILLSFEAGESRSMDDVLMALVEEGRIRIEDAFTRAKDRHRFLITAG
ncbi:MAG: Flp pilus assembly complex ATPase component TadA [Planctomycetes bacterium]|nr:Flp pilus assembly complex ATPase component TadA [Planctomycetota bacterium]